MTLKVKELKQILKTLPPNAEIGVTPHINTTVARNNYQLLTNTYEINNKEDLILFEQEPNYTTKKYRVFDWEQAINIILDNHLTKASAGLDGQGTGNFGLILVDGKPTNEYYHQLKGVNSIPMLLDSYTLEYWECWKEVTYEEYLDFVDEWDTEILDTYGFTLESKIEL